MSLNDAQRQAIAAIDGPPQKQEATPEGQAQQSGAPKSEAAQMAEEPFLEFDVGGQKRRMTQSQITGMASRYTALNHKNAVLKPVTDVIENFLRSNPNMTPGQLAEQLQQLAAAQQPNVQFGRGGVNDPGGDGVGRRGDTDGDARQMRGQRGNDPDFDADFDRWENENASTLPPGYRDMFKNMSSMASMIQQQQAMMQQLLGQSAGHVDAARMAHQQSAQVQAGAVQQTIANNLDRAQAQLRLPTEAANDFMMFAQQRGYTVEDFADPDLTMMVMQDFANNMQSPEMDRLRQIHQRRTAYVSQGGGSPAGGGAPASPAEQDFEGFTSRIMAQKRL